MASPIETIRRLLLSHQADDGVAFRQAVQDLIEEERRKNHHVVARDLERLLQGGGEVRRLKPLRTLYAWENDIPKDGDRGLSLLRALEPERELEELVLDAQVRTLLLRFTHEASRGELFRAHGVPPPSRLLLCGPPGCGKTSAAEAVARALLLPLAIVRFDVVISSYLGETAANLRKIFDFVATRPMVVLFDEFDAIAKQRDDDFEHGELKRVVNAFLQLMDSLRSDNIFIAATNHQGMLDSAVWRRFDEIVLLGLPSAEARRQVILQSLAGLQMNGSPRWDSIESRTEGWSHADLERIAQMAVRDALLMGDQKVEPEVLDAAVCRYEERMAVVGASIRHSTSTRDDTEVHSGHATLSRIESPSALGDAPLRSGQAGAKEATQPESNGPSRARATRPTSPRSRSTGGSASDRESTEGVGDRG